MASATRHVMRLIADDLALVGVRVKDHNHLRGSGQPYKPAVPVLITWIDQLRTVELSDSDRAYLWDTLVQALTDREARPEAGPALVRLFHEPSLPPMTRWAVGNALDQVADVSLLDDALAIAQDRSLGLARQMVVHLLGRIGKGARREEVIDVLIGLLDDESVVTFAIIALRKLHATRAVDAIARHVDSHIPIAKKEARATVAKFRAAA